MPYGTANVDVIQSSTSGTPPQFNDGNGTQVGTLCRAWASYAYVASGSSPTVRASFNVSSITRNSTGNYTFAFTNAFSDTNYSVVVTTNSGSIFNSSIGNVTSKATNNMGVQVGYVSNTTGQMANFDYALDFSVFR